MSRLVTGLVDLWLRSLLLTRPLRTLLLELVTAGLLYVFQYLAVELLFGVLHLEYL